MELLIGPAEWLRWVSIATMVVVLIGGLYSILMHSKDAHSSISEAIAHTRQTYVLMGLLLTIGGSLYYSYMAFWLIPYYDISDYAYAILVIAFIAQIGMAWIPANKAKRHLQKVHFICGGIVAVSMVVFSTLALATSSLLSPFMRTLLLVFVLASYAYLAFFITSTKYRFRYFLIFESIFVTTFAIVYGLLASTII